MRMNEKKKKLPTGQSDVDDVQWAFFIPFLLLLLVSSSSRCHPGRVLLGLVAALLFTVL